jgi:hypothetical protein
LAPFQPQVLATAAALGATAAVLLLAVFALLLWLLFGRFPFVFLLVVVAFASSPAGSTAAGSTCVAATLTGGADAPALGAANATAPRAGSVLAI